MVSLSLSTSDQPIRAQPGENVDLPCESPMNDTIGVQWVKGDDQNYHVLHYVKDEPLNTEHQDPSFTNRAVPVDPQMGNNDISLRIINVTSNDTGYYKCCLLRKRSKRSDSFCKKPYKILFLNVSGESRLR